ncbi:MAG: AAA family ATPase [Clostridia bacterium]|nr:AAA family ATPase [Clostridia bacterium]
MNIIYADNGAGKTTLSCILHSLSTNNPEIINNHKRIGTTENPSVSIKDDANKFHNYNGTKWNNPIPEISVFDAHFVAENVYTGFQISSDHRKHLYQFVLGSKGVKIAAKIERVKGLIEKTNNDLSNIYQKIQAKTNNPNVDDVIGIPYDADIEQKISDKMQELKVAQDNNVIVSHSDLFDINVKLPAIDFEELKRLFDLTIGGIGKAYLDLVNSRIKELEGTGLSNASNWLHTGLDYANKTKRCPYCGSNITGINLIEGYNQYFNESYKEAFTSIKSQLQKLSSINVENIITKIKSSYNEIKKTLEFWHGYIEKDKELPHLVLDEEKIIHYFAEIQSLLSEKQINPLNTIPTDVLNELTSKLHDCGESIENINIFVKKVNEKITDLKNGIRNLSDVQKELASLQLTKSRYEAPLKELCSLAQTTKRHIDIWNKINRKFQQDQKEQSNTLFSQYGSKINEYLRDVFHTKFLVSEIKDGGYKGRAKEANLNYTLTFNGTPIEQDGFSNKSFKNVLSEGDKNTIAFSFFLAKLQLDSNLAQKIIVFDDPLTSLDLNRRNATIHQLCLLYQKCQQVIVLSHNLHFLVELNGRKSLGTQDKKVLQIMHDGYKSYIREYQIKKEWLDNYHKSLLSMKAFIDTPIEEKQEEAVNAIRISLETFLKLKFCLYIKNPEATFGQIVAELKNSSCNFVNNDKPQVIDKLNQLVDISWRGHHGSIEERETYTEKALSTSEARDYVEMTLKLLSEEL